MKHKQRQGKKIERERGPRSEPGDGEREGEKMQGLCDNTFFTMFLYILRIRRWAPPAYFSFFQMPEETINKFIRYNNVKADPQRRWKYEELQRTGVHGIKLDSLEDEHTLEYEEYIRIWGLTKWMFDQAEKTVESEKATS